MPDLISYFIAFYLIGKFWLGHHDLFDKLRGLDGRLMNVNLLYLSLIALLPFPTGVLGDHGGLTVAVVIFAAAVTLAGLAEVCCCGRRCTADWPRTTSRRSGASISTRRSPCR